MNAGHDEDFRPGRAEWLLNGAVAACAAAARDCLKEARGLMAPGEHRARARAIAEAAAFARLSAKLVEAAARFRPHVYVYTVEIWKNGVPVETRTTRRGVPPIFSVRMPAPPLPPPRAAGLSAEARKAKADGGQLPDTGNNRVRGAQPGNANRLAHGRYAKARLADHDRIKRRARAALTLVENMRKAHKALAALKKRARPAA